MSQEVPQWLVEVHRTYWGNPAAPLHDLGDSPHVLSRKFDVLDKLDKSIDRRVLIREDYRDCYDYIKGSFGGKTGIVLYGHPGTGKSLFLQTYGLARALQDKFTVCLCVLPYYCFVFDQHGVRCVNYNALRFDHEVLIYVDSNTRMPLPPDAFIASAGVRVQGLLVQGASPGCTRWKGWAKELREVYVWVTKTWAAEEIRQIKSFPEDAFFTPSEICAVVGPSPMECSYREPRPSPDAVYAPYLRPPLPLPTPLVNDPGPDTDTLLQALNFQGASIQNDRADFHAFFFIELIPGRPRAFRWRHMGGGGYVEYFVPTEYLRDVAWRGYGRLTREGQKEVCRALAPFPRVCGGALEVLGVRWLSAQPPSQVELELGDPVQDVRCIFQDARFDLSFPADLRVLDSGVTLSLSKDDISDDNLNVLWIPGPAAGFSGVDAVALTHTHTKSHSQSGGRRTRMMATVLQMTLARSHTISPEGIARVVKHLDDLDIEGEWEWEWRFVLVVPSVRVGQVLASRTKVVQVQRQPRASDSDSSERQIESEKTQGSGPTPLPSHEIEIPVGYMVAPFLSEVQRRAMDNAFPDLDDTDTSTVVFDVL